MAILASAFGPSFARRHGMRGALLLGLGADVLSMALLSASPLLIGSASAFALLCAATGALGLGFGATVMALNTLIERAFPGRADGAVLALNALLGLGTALAPLLIALFTAFGVWWALPLLTAVFAMSSHVCARRVGPAAGFGLRAPPARRAPLPVRSGCTPRRCCSTASSRP